MNKKGGENMVIYSIHKIMDVTFKTELSVYDGTQILQEKNSDITDKINKENLKINITISGGSPTGRSKKNNQSGHFVRVKVAIDGRNPSNGVCYPFNPNKSVISIDGKSIKNKHYRDFADAHLKTIGNFCMYSADVLRNAYLANGDNTDELQKEIDRLAKEFSKMSKAEQNKYAGTVKYGGVI